MTTNPDVLALSVVDAAEARLLEHVERERLRLHRLRLQATVRVVTPLARDLAAQQGFTLDAVAQLLRPYGHGPQVGAQGNLLARPKSALRPSAHPLVRPLDRHLPRRIAREGIVLPPRPGRSDRLGFVPAGPSLECAGWVGPCWICTSGLLGHVLLAGDLPESVISAAWDRHVGELVEHPALIGRPYRVKRVMRLTAGATVLSFSVGLQSHAMPWADLLASEMEHGA